MSDLAKFGGEAVFVWLIAVASGAALQGLYKMINWYPPKPIFWGAIGVTTFAAFYAIGVRPKYPS